MALVILAKVLLFLGTHSISRYRLRELYRWVIVSTNRLPIKPTRLGDSKCYTTVSSLYSKTKSQMLERYDWIEHSWVLSFCVFCDFYDIKTGEKKNKIIGLNQIFDYKKWHNYKINNMNMFTSTVLFGRIDWLFINALRTRPDCGDTIDSILTVFDSVLED